MSGWERLGYTSEGYTPTWQYSGCALLLLTPVVILLMATFV